MNQAGVSHKKTYEFSLAKKNMAFPLLLLLVKTLLFREFLRLHFFHHKECSMARLGRQRKENKKQ